MGSVMPVQCVISCMTCCADILYYCVVYWIYDLISCVLADGCFTQVYGRLWSYAEVTILYIMLILDGSRMFNLNFCCMLRLRTSTLYLCAFTQVYCKFLFYDVADYFVGFIIVDFCAQRWLNVMLCNLSHLLCSDECSYVFSFRSS